MKTKTVSVARAKLLDQRAIHRYGIPAFLLMDHAGRALAEAVRSLCPKPNRITVLAGTGNNGGDGVAAARWLCAWGYRVTVLTMKPSAEWKGSVALHFSMARRMGVRFGTFVSIPPTKRVAELKKARVLVDALLGTGATGHLKLPLFDAIANLNASGRPIVSADIPSGLDADTGKTHDASIKARITVTMAAPKHGLLKPSARRYVGKLIVADVGIPVGGA